MAKIIISRELIKSMDIAMTEGKFSLRERNPNKCEKCVGYCLCGKEIAKFTQTKEHWEIEIPDWAYTFNDVIVTPAPPPTLTKPTTELDKRIEYWWSM